MQYPYLILFGILILLSSCKSTKEKKVGEMAEELPTVYINEVPAEDDCYYPRKTIRSFEDQAATILHYSDEWVITVGSPDKRYVTCGIPEQFQKDGLLVIFSGDKLEVMPHEKRFAIPLRLQSMRLQD